MAYGNTTTTPVVVVVVCIMVGVVTLTPHSAEAQMSCNSVFSSLYPCLNFVMRGDVMSPSCCSGVKSLYGAAKSTADRRSVCSCLKGVASNANPAQVGRAASLPSKCGLSVPYKINPQLDCSKVN
ncbi:non-specific lipid-transfer protein 1-like [Ipomoea triloba]|uniref:non-specific lipid-transfer protein 1-like n=1 Tax=Ipomoea triloba TaxID=35885 RepID=UPI00125CEDE9|nr:non-specific lipid-transfer protein 1-like [Ipomoea triloba]GMC46539.1 non-specific lipid-transfer protein 1-like [Ipomoea batatas]